MKALTLRFALPAVVILTIVTVAIVAVALFTGAHPGTVWSNPCC